MPRAHADRLPYAPPTLVEFGTLRDLTQAIGSKSMLDGGMGAGMRRSQA